MKATLSDPRIHGRMQLDTPHSAFDVFAGLAADLCGASVGVASITDDAGAWGEAFAVFATGRAFVPSALVFRDETLVASGVVAVPEAHADWSYAGAAIRDGSGRALGTLAVLDAADRPISLEAREALAVLATVASRSFEMRALHEPDADADEVTMLGSALELVADPIAIFRRGEPGKMPRFVYVNRSFTEIFGYTSAEVIGKGPKVLAGPDTGTKTAATILAARGDAPIDYGTIVLYAANGERLLVEMLTHGLNPTHRIVSYRDVTRERAAQAALTDANARTKSLVSINGDPILTFDRHGACIDANPAAETVFGRSRSEMLGNGFRAAAPGDRFPDCVAIAHGSGDARGVDFATKLRHRDGADIAMECRAIPILVRGANEGAYVFLKDVTERERLAALVRRQADRATALCAISALNENDTVDRVDAVLKLVLQTFGMQSAYVAECVPFGLLVTNSVGEQIHHVNDVVESTSIAGWNGHISAPLTVAGRAFGSIGFVSREIVAYDDADRDFVRLVAALVSSALERRLERRELDRLAYFDVLSGLPNRAHFMRCLADEISRPGNTFALHFIDLDGFKVLNDRAGHAIGDLALREVSRRLESACGVDDVAARLGGDEFVVLQTSVCDRPSAQIFGWRIVDTLSVPYHFEGATFELGASVGFALFPLDGTTADELMRRADEAMYRAKLSGRSRAESVTEAHAI